MPKGSLRPHRLGEGLPDLATLKDEIRDMTDVLMGRETPPVDMGVSTLMEVASAYHARALEIESLILEKEREGSVLKGGNFQKFRTGEVRRFVEMAKSASDLGSRRITVAQMEQEAARLGRDI